MSGIFCGDPSRHPTVEPEKRTMTIRIMQDIGHMNFIFAYVLHYDNGVVMVKSEY